MKNIKTVSIEKIDVQGLSGDELDVLRKFGKTKAFKILSELASESKTRRAFSALEATDIKELTFLSGTNVGLSFVLDAVKRAEEELKSRGDKEDIDNEE